MPKIPLPNIARATHRHLKVGAGLLCLLLLNGCALQPAAPPHEAGMTLQGHRPSADMAPWIASGKLALRSENGGDNANCRWQRFDKDYEAMSLSGPIGFGAIQIISERDNVWWLDDDIRQPLAALALTQSGHATLASLPFSALGGWLLGAIEDTSPWHVEIDSFQPKNGWQLPRKLSMQLPSQALQIAAELSLKVIVLEWQIEAATAAVKAPTS